MPCTGGRQDCQYVPDAGHKTCAACRKWQSRQKPRQKNGETPVPPEEIGAFGGAGDGNAAPVANAPAPGLQPRPAASALEQQLPTLLTQAAQAGAAAAFEMQRSAAPLQPPPQSPEHPPHESVPSVAGAHLPLGARLEAELGPIDAERPRSRPLVRGFA